MALEHTTAVPVAVEKLTRRFGSKVALDSVSLTVPRGCVFGLLGENGAGKTTLIKHLMGLLNAQQGAVRVFGEDPVKHPERALVRVGYLSEDRDLPRWMRVWELLRYTQGFFPTWDDAYAEELLEVFQLDPSQKIKTLSMGQTAKAGLLAAIAHRPELLILDEPSSGLDAVVRKQILDAILRTVAEEGRTVLFSSHLLDEVERVSDYIAIIHNGKVLARDTLVNLRNAHWKFEVEFPAAHSGAPRFKNRSVLRCDGAGTAWTLWCDSNAQDAKAELAALNVRVLRESHPTLEDIFLARVGHSADTTETESTVSA